MGLLDRLTGHKKHITEIEPLSTFALSTKEIPDKNTLKEQLKPIIETSPEFILAACSLNIAADELLDILSQFFPKTHIILIKTRGLLATDKLIVPKSGFAMLSFSRKHFRVNVWVPKISKEHKILQGISSAVSEFSTSVTKYSPKFPNALNLSLWDSFQNGHLLINTYEKHINENGLYNTPLLGVILHPDNPFKKNYLLYKRGPKTFKVINGFIFVSIFTKLKIKSKICIGLHPLMPLKITEAKDNVILKLNNKPAYIAYKEYIMKKGVSEGELERDLPVIFASYQFGFPNIRNPRKPEIRIALKKTEENGLLFNGDIPEGSTIWIMHAEKEKLITASSGLKEPEIENKIGGIVFSSIFRLIKMKNGYINDINALKEALDSKTYFLFNTYLEIYYKNSKEAYSNSTSNLLNMFYQ